MAKTKSKAQWELDAAAAVFEATTFMIVARGKDVESIKQALRSEYGSLEARASEFRRAVGWQEPLLGTAEDFWRKVFNSLVGKLLAIDWWKEAAAQDVDGYRRGLAELLSAIKRVMNVYCDIKPNRPQKDEERDDLIVRIRLVHPKWTFGQVAIEYTRKTGSDITANSAERIFKRCCARYVDDLIRRWRPEFHLGPFLKLVNLELARDQVGDSGGPDCEGP